ncbi:MAG: hypothetical protein VKO21_08455 [Candidatus Sericytochromatia bacterium]|nr:hypothetical protein [Candidatus Sericytochromatia bacterium]
MSRTPLRHSLLGRQLTGLCLMGWGLSGPWGQPAQCSTLPVTDFRRDQTLVAAGLYTLALDRALDDDTTVGAAVSPLLGVAGLRWTRRVAGEADAPSLGFSVHLGTTPPDFTGIPRTEAYGSVLAPQTGLGYRTDTYTGWTAVVQPQLVASLPVGPLRLRVAVGPAALVSSLSHLGGLKYRGDLLLVINPELALRILPHAELTLGGQGLVGLRAAL